MTTIQDILARKAQTHRDDTALIINARRVTHGELDTASNRLANYLIDQGFQKGSIIGLLIHDRVQLIQAVLGVLKAGCIFAPFDAFEPQKRRDAMIEAAQPDLFIVEPTFFDRLAPWQDRLKIIFSAANEQGPAPYHAYPNTEQPSYQADPDDRCYLFFTSGSTGTPKGVIGRLKSLLHFIHWEIKTFQIEPGTRVSQLSAHTFDAFLRDIFTPLCAGGVICVPPDRETVMDPARLRAWLERDKVHVIHCVPSLFRLLLREPLTRDHLPDLRLVMLSGERLHPAEAASWYDRIGTRAQLINLYGPTEATMTKFFHPIQPADTQKPSIPIGKPMRGVQAILLDREMAVCDPGVPGEIYIRTPYLTHGYLNDPEQTAQIFVQNPFSDQPDLILKTGDLGRLLPDGDYELLGRLDQQLKIRGNRVEPGEIEARLNHHPGVVENAVLLKNDQLVAYYNASETPPEPNELWSFLSRDLPDYMVPTRYIQLDAMPHNRSGKIDRAALPDPDQVEGQAERPVVPPRNPLEQNLAQIWSEVLEREVGGVHDHFFQLGGHSLLAARVLTRVEERLHVLVPLRRIFEAPTIAELAQVIEAIQAEADKQEDTDLLDLVETMSEAELEAMMIQLESEEP